MNKFLFYCFILITLFSCSGFQKQKSMVTDANEKIFFNGKIFTANRNQPFVEAVAIRGDKIIGTGKFEEIKKLVSENAEQINLDGKCLLPGFIDSHNHAISGGKGLMRANVYDSVFTVEQLAVYANEVKENGKGMTGDILSIDGINIETWIFIDKLNKIFNSGIYKNQAVILFGSDGHTGWANKFLLQKAGITKKYISLLSKDEKKNFGIHSDNEPNGFLTESGFDKIYAVIPKEKVDIHEAAMKAVEYNNGFGITAWLDPGVGHETLDAYKSLSQENKLTVHVAALMVGDADGNVQPQIENLKKIQHEYSRIENLSIIGFKIYADGVIEYPSQTAALSMPYKNLGTSGTLLFDPKKFANFVTIADKENFLVHVHAIGDRAVTETLNGFEAARKANGNKIIPHTITHMQIVNPNDFSRFKKLNVLASLQLLWALGDVTTIDIVKPYIAPKLYQYQYPAKSLLDAETIICGASDWSVSTANPFEAIYEAETRKGKKGVLDSTQCMSRMEMFYAYTINSAKALRMENMIGSIENEKLADFILVDKDVFIVNPEEMKTTKILWMMFGGEKVYFSQK